MAAKNHTSIFVLFSWGGGSRGRMVDAKSKRGIKNQKDSAANG